MSWRSELKRFWLGVSFCCLTAVTYGSDQKALDEQLTRMSRDIYMSQKSIQAETAKPEERAAALAKESTSVESMKRLVFSINSPEEVQKTLDTLKGFGYRMNTHAEKKAFQQTVLMLEQRLKYLSQTENPAMFSQLDALEAVNTEILAKSVEISANRTRGTTQRVAQVRRSGPTPAGLLGANVANGKTVFSVYSPEATEVCVVLFEKAADKSGKSHVMQKGPDGVWRTTLEGEMYGKFYGFTAAGPTGPGYLFDAKRLLSDPYALANVDHDGKSVIPKPEFRNFTWTDQGFKPPAAKDLVIYEMHVKDFTAHASAGVKDSVKGKYLGLLEGKNTDKVLGHLIDLGVNAVELLPCHEFDNNFAGVTNHWGYMTSHFMAPECSFASGKEGQAIREFKQMVNGLHKAGIAVIMDVVYNHTAEGNEKGLPLNFKGLDNPGYYRLTADRRFYWNGTGCGNEFRSENPMTRKYILDTLKFWMKEYHVDGFRFDLGTILDKETMNAIINELPAHTILVGEPWAADWQRNQWGKQDFRNTKLGKWNDDYREKVRGFMGGNPERNDLMTVIAGSCFWWSAKPSESVNYIECHDGYTMADLFKGDKNRVKLGAAVLLTSQGIPMIHQGQEFMKSKKGNHNSYDQDNAINWIDWSVKKANNDVYQFYKGLVGLRNKYENFRHGTALNNQHIAWMQPANHRGLGYHLKGKTDFLVLLNSDSNDWISFGLPGSHEWIVVSNGDQIDDEKGLGTAKGDYKVPPLKAVILKNKR
jgi:pullulanase/glycogen debranching enzyme